MFKGLVISTLAAAALAGFVAPSASAAVTIPLTNNSFEDPDRNGGWGVYNTIPGWYTVEGTGIEIQTSGVVVNAYTGDQYVELDSHNQNKTNYDGTTVLNPNQTNSTMAYDINLDNAGSHTMTFYFQPRTNDANDNGVSFGVEVWLNNNWISVASDSIANQGRNTHGGWAQYSLDFDVTNTGEKHRLYFSADGTQNTLGGFIDEVGLTAAVPEPATWLMMLAGFGLVGFNLKRRKAATLAA